MPLKKEYCGTCNRGLITQGKNNFGFFVSILLALVPKCPFCILAYTSTVVLCGKDTLLENQHNHFSTLSISLTAFFCSLIIAGLILNFRGLRTKYALALSCVGILMIIYSVIIGGGQELYYVGVSIEFMAIWLNGSLIFILRKFKNSFGIIKGTAAGSPYS